PVWFSIAFFRGILLSPTHTSKEETTQSRPAFHLDGCFLKIGSGEDPHCLSSRFLQIFLQIYAIYDECPADLLSPCRVYSAASIRILPQNRPLYFNGTVVGRDRPRFISGYRHRPKHCTGSRCRCAHTH